MIDYLIEGILPFHLQAVVSFDNSRHNNRPFTKNHLVEYHPDGQLQ